MKTFVAVFLAMLAAGGLLLNQQNRIHRWEMEATQLMVEIDRAVSAIKSENVSAEESTVDQLQLLIFVAHNSLKNAESHLQRAVIGSNSKPLEQAIVEGRESMDVRAKTVEASRANLRSMKQKLAATAQAEWKNKTAMHTRNVIVATRAFKESPLGTRSYYERLLEDALVPAEWHLKSENYGQSPVDLESAVAKGRATVWETRAQEYLPELESDHPPFRMKVWVEVATKHYHAAPAQADSGLKTQLWDAIIKAEVAIRDAD